MASYAIYSLLYYIYQNEKFIDTLFHVPFIPSLCLSDSFSVSCDSALLFQGTQLANSYSRCVPVRSH